MGSGMRRLAAFKNDKRVNPNYELYNGLLSHYEDRKNTILRKFFGRACRLDFESV